jgi:FkbM family methyltransferase
MSIEYFDKESLDRWFKDNGDKTHRINYDLNENSIVFDIGGYEGGWSSDILEKYNCIIYIFEPIKEYYDIIVERFYGNNKVRVFNFGLSNKDEEVYISNNTASSSIHIEGNHKEKIILLNINNFIENESLNSVDLVKINIEGSEYDLLDEVIKMDNQIKFINIQIQFHKNIVPDWNNRRNRIREELKKTHKLTYDYSFVWENWEKITK